MNRIQQEALAKAVGMSKDDLAKSLQDREVLAALGAKEGTALEAYNKLKEKGLSNEAIATKLGDKNLANSLHQESIQARFAASVNKVKELFVQIADLMLPIVEPIADAVGLMASLISQSLKYVKVLGGAIAAYKLLRVLGDANYRNQIKTNIAARFGNKEGEKNIAQKLYSNILGKEGFLMKVKENVQNSLANIFGLNNLSIQELRIISKVKGAAITTKEFITDKAGYALDLARNAAAVVGNAISTIGNSIKKSGLLASIAEMAMRAFSSLSAIPFIGPILGVAGAAAAAGLGYMYYNKADDMMSPGANSSGYGSRTLMGPEGAIALNNKDTVIAGTDLFKGNDVMSGPAGSMQMPDNSEAKKTNELLRAVLSQPKPQPIITMNDVALGTAVDMGAFSIQ